MTGAEIDAALAADPAFAEVCDARRDLKAVLLRRLMEAP